MKILKNMDNCYGCGCCANICPVDAISMQYDREGFLIPCINSELCLECGKCIEKCIAYKSEVVKKDYPDKVVALKAGENTLENSSSGGVFSILATEVLRNEGKVFGAAWTDDFVVKHIGITDEKDLSKLQLSKYLQSNVKFTYREAKIALDNGKKSCTLELHVR